MSEVKTIVEEVVEVKFNVLLWLTELAHGGKVVIEVDPCTVQTTVHVMKDGVMNRTVVRDLIVTDNEDEFVHPLAACLMELARLYPRT